jgi:hypothetical protein
MTYRSVPLIWVALVARAEVIKHTEETDSPFQALRILGLPVCHTLLVVAELFSYRTLPGVDGFRSFRFSLDRIWRTKDID